MRLKIAGALAVMIVGLACGANQESPSVGLVSRTSPVQIGEMAPDFELADQNDRQVKLSSARGTSTVLVFYRGHW